MKELIVVVVLCILVFVVFYRFNLKYKGEKFNNCSRIEKYVLGNSSPTIGLIGGVHGNEPAGAIALSELVSGKWQLPKELQNAKYIIIPRANLCGLQNNNRYMSKFKNKDLNRNFSEYGPLDDSSKEVLNTFRDCDFIVDIHEGYDYHVVNKQSVGSTLAGTTPYSVQIADRAVHDINKTIINENKKFISRHREDCDIAGTLSCYMAKRNRHYILIEITGQQNIQPIETRVYQTKFLITNILSQIL